MGTRRRVSSKKRRTENPIEKEEIVFRYKEKPGPIPGAWERVLPEPPSIPSPNPASSSVSGCAMIGFEDMKTQNLEAEIKAWKTVVKELLKMAVQANSED